MRPEKAWRPIVTVEIDKHNNHETVLGVDGQNPNLKQFFKMWVFVGCACSRLSTDN